MRLHHLALWSRRIELLRDFYTTYFDGRAGEKYENPAKGFESYFVTFADGVSLAPTSRRPTPHSIWGLRTSPSVARAAPRSTGSPNGCAPTAIPC